MVKREKQKIHYSNCGEIFLKKTAKECIATYEGMAYEQLRLKNYQEAHNLFQHADHYKRVEHGLQV